MNPDIADTYATLIESLQALAAQLRAEHPKPEPVDEGGTFMATWVEPEKADD